MGIQFEHPYLLFLLLGLPLVWILTWRSSVGHGRRGVVACSTLRSVMLALLIAALAEPYTEETDSETIAPAVVFVVDHSASVGSAATEVPGKITTYKGALPVETENTTLVFASEAWPESAEPIGGADQTNIELAIRKADAEFAEARNKQFVLFTDGRSTTGNPVELARRLRGMGRVVHVVPTGDSSPRGPRLIGLTPPSAATVGRPARVEARLASDWPAEVVVRLLDTDHVEQARKVIELEGERVVVLTMQPERHGIEHCVVVVECEEAGVSEVHDSSFYVAGAPRVLLVDPFPEEVGYLEKALEGLRVQLDTIAVGEFPDRFMDLTNYDSIVISDWPEPATKQEQLEALTDYVEYRGGGLVFVGGSNVSIDRWQGSVFEELLPVNFLEIPKPPPPKPEVPHVCFVLDRSGSMAGEKLDMVKLAVQKSLDSLPPQSVVTIIVFDGSPHVIAKSIPVARKSTIASKVNSIDVGGGTTMGPAIREGIRLLWKGSKLRYMIVLTDGQTSDDSNRRLWRELADDMDDSGIRMSGIAVGYGASEDILKYLSRRTGGTYYACLDSKSIPELFIDEAESIQQEAEIETIGFLPKPGPDVDMLRSVSCEMLPELTGNVTAHPKEDPLVQVALVKDDDEVLLAAWPKGMGRVVAFTSSAKDDWAHRWIRNPDSGRLWTEIVHWTMRDASKYQTASRAKIDGHDVHVVVRATDTEKGVAAAGLVAKAEMTPIEGDSGSKVVMECRELRPGLYEARGRCVTSGNHKCDITLYDGEEQAAAVTLVVRPSNIAEMAFTGPDQRAIEALCDAGGGRVTPSPDEVAGLATVSDSDQTRRREAHWPWLILLATIVWPFDVAARRLFS